MARDIGPLLRSLRSLNDKDDIRQRLDPPPRRPDRIATLAPAAPRVLTPMLRVRFAFADAWHNAALGQTWLGLDAIAAASGRGRIRAVPPSHREALATIFPDRAEPHRLTLFGLAEAGAGATYLVWGADGAEPAVCAFYGGGCDCFLDLGRHLEFLVGDRVHDDSEEILVAGTGLPRAEA